MNKPSSAVLQSSVEGIKWGARYNRSFQMLTRHYSMIVLFVPLQVDERGKLTLSKIIELVNAIDKTYY